MRVNPRNLLKFTLIIIGLYINFILYSNCIAYLIQHFSNSSAQTQEPNININNKIDELAPPPTAARTTSTKQRDEGVDEINVSFNFKFDLLENNKTTTTSDPKVLEGNSTATEEDDDDVRSPAERKLFKILKGGNTTEELVQPYVNTTVTEPHNACKDYGSSIILFVAVLSHPKNLDERNAIRNSWGNYTSYKGHEIKVIFFLGTSNITNEFENISAEQLTHNDLVVDELEEDYYLLTLKVLRILKWFLSNCHKAQFFLKSDDDSYINVRIMTRYILEKHTPLKSQFIGGVIHKHAPVPRMMSDKFFVPKSFYHPNTFPIYAGGPCYLITNLLISQIFLKSLQTPLFHLEDVYINGFIGSNQLKAKMVSLPLTKHFFDNVKRHKWSREDYKIRNFKTLMCIHPVSPQFFLQKN